METRAFATADEAARSAAAMLADGDPLSSAPAGMNPGLGRDDIRALLDDLSAELAGRGARAELSTPTTSRCSTASSASPPSTRGSTL